MVAKSADLPEGSTLGRDLSAAVVLFHEAIAARLGLSAGDHKALDVIDREGPLTASELARRTGLSPAAITALVDRLERAGYAKRGSDHTDRRRIMVSVCEHPDPVIADTFASLGRTLGAVMSGYSDHERAAVLDFVTNAITALQSETQQLSEHALSAASPKATANPEMR